MTGTSKITLEFALYCHLCNKSLILTCGEQQELTPFRLEESVLTKIAGQAALENIDLEITAEVTEETTPWDELIDRTIKITNLTLSSDPDRKLDDKLKKLLEKMIEKYPMFEEMIRKNTNWQ